VGTLSRLLPAVLLLGATWLLAWQKGGSIAAADWLPEAILAALLLGTVLVSGAGVRPPGIALGGLAALIALAAWAAISIGWSSSPPGARDEALLTVLYAATLAVALVTLRTLRERTGAVGLCVAALTSIALATAIKLIVAPDGSLFPGGRLFFPITYVNAVAALFVLGVWPAAVLAAQRTAPIVVRAAALGAGCALLATSIMAQSKGSALGLLVSAIVVFAVSPQRLRLLAPTAVLLACAAVGFRPLTAPYRATTGASLEAAIRRGGLLVLALAAAGVVAGAVLAACDRRWEPGPRARRIAGLAVLAVLVAALAAGAALFLARHDHPGRFVEAKWAAFKRYVPVGSAGATTSTHLLSLGSNRYDFWRVALDSFADHPVAGVGARGYYSAYLLERRSNETPLRAHSLYLDEAAEGGLVGLALLLATLGLLLAALVRRRREAPAIAALGAAAYFLAHAGVDWMWTFPALGIPLFLLIGAGAAGGSRPLPRAASLGGATLAFAVAVLAFAPPYLSSRFTARAYSSPARAADDLRWARRLDPLSLNPSFARWRLATTPAERVAALEAARALEPRSIAVLYHLGLAQLAAGDRGAARTTLARALALDPRDGPIKRALRTARR
jgi:hypothetical protein